jgi:hypothetical protein
MNKPITNLEQAVHAQIVPCLGQEWLYWLHDSVYNQDMTVLDMAAAIEHKVKEIAYKAAKEQPDVQE